MKLRVLVFAVSAFLSPRRAFAQENEMKGIEGWNPEWGVGARGGILSMIPRPIEGADTIPEEEGREVEEEDQEMRMNVAAAPPEPTSMKLAAEGDLGDLDITSTITMTMWTTVTMTRGAVPT